MIHHDQGEYDKAREMYEQSLELKRELGDKSGIAQSLHQLGSIHLGQGEYDKAREMYEQALAAFEALGAKSEYASVLGQLGKLAEAEKDDKTALRNWLIAFSIFEELKSPNKDIVGRLLARMHERLGEVEFERLSAEVKQEVEEELGTQ